MMLLKLLLFSMMPLGSLSGGLRNTRPYLYEYSSIIREHIPDPDEEREPPVYLSRLTDYRIVEFYDDKATGIPEKYSEIAEKITSYAKAGNVSISFHAVACLMSTQYCDSLDEDLLPSFFLFKPNEKEGKEITKLSVNYILQQLGLPTVDDEEEEPVHNRSLSDLQSDVHRAFQTAISNVYDEGTNKLDPIKSQTLKNFLLLLHKTLPISWPVHKLVKEVMTNFMYVSKNSAYLESIVKSYPVKTETYSKNCSGKSDGGFTCAFWELLHAVSVGVVEYNKKAIEKHETIATEYAAKIIRDYIEVFGIGNTAIQSLFINEFDSCAHDRCHILSPKREGNVEDWIKLPLWLSETHSSIKYAVAKQRRRLTAEETLRMQWPPVTLCRKCWVGAEWNEEIVFKYLEAEYTQIENLDASARREIFGAQFENSTKTNALQTRQSSVVFLSFFILAARIVMYKRSLLTSSSGKKD
jgi:hypothetical protein